MKTFILVCASFGRKFSFHAIDEEDAVKKATGWCNYHGHSFRDYSVQEITENTLNDLHDEYVN